MIRNRLQTFAGLANLLVLALEPFQFGWQPFFRYGKGKGQGFLERLV